MRKVMAILLTVLAAVVLFAGCPKKPAPTPQNDPEMKAQMQKMMKQNMDKMGKGGPPQ